MQKLIQGIDSSNEISSEIIKAGCKSIFLITGKHLQKNNFNFESLQVSHFIKQGINVNEDEIEIAFNQYKKNDQQAIVAIGGGSVIDIAKAIIYRAMQSDLSTPFFVAVPTTAGSGSEATHFAVVYKENKKHSLGHKKLLPAIAVLDAALTASLSSYQTAVSGMDALAQAIESYWNVNATDGSKRYAAESIELWKKYFPAAVRNDYTDAREKMLQSAHLAGKAINITRTTGPHALSYYLTANHNVPHGQAVALFLPVFFIYNNMDSNLCSMLGVSNAVKAKDNIQQIMSESGLATSFSELNINKEDVLNKLLNDVNEERFANNPVAFNKEKLKQLFEKYL